MAVDDLHRALHDPGEPALQPLQSQAAELLLAVQAPPRLVAHLRLVHDVAVQLVDWLVENYPQWPVDRTAVCFGAATHDIGKVVHREELSEPGSHHESVGYDLLIAYGVPDDLAQFARTHGQWDRPDASDEDLVVTLADKIWKGKREAALEQRVAEHLASSSGEPVWQSLMSLDDMLERIARDADRRLDFQNRFPV
jgi:hypothetical protein